MLSIKTKDGRLEFGPGGAVEGVAGWQLQKQPESAHVYLMWYTIGKGDEDIGIVDEREFNVESGRQEHPFSFQLPDRPYSFEGALISLQWAIELVTDDPTEVERLDIMVSPWVKKVVLPNVDSPQDIDLSDHDD